MKTTLVLCMTMALVGCSKIQTADAQQKNQPARGATGATGTARKAYTAPSMGSPIIISDGSTHIRYPNFGIEYANEPHLTIQGPVSKLQCVKGIKVTSGQPCPPGGTPINLNFPWKLELAAADTDNPANGIKVATVKPSGDGSQVFVHLHRNLIDPEQDQNPTWQALNYVDVGLGNFPLNTATLINTQTAGTVAALACTSPCEIHIY